MASELTKTAPEAAFRGLTMRWTSQLQEASADRLLPATMDDVALAALLVSVRWGAGFSEDVAGLIEAAVLALENTNHNAWMNPISWELSLAGTSRSPAQHHSVDLLTESLDAPNSSIRLWMMDLAWMVRPWLAPERAIPRLLQNLAGTLAGPFRAGGLAAALVPDHEAFWRIAENFQATGGFQDQYSWRLDQLRSEGVMACQAPFLSREARCRRIAMDALVPSETIDAVADLGSDDESNGGAAGVLAARVIERLQELTEHLGGPPDSGLASVWEELCCQVQSQRSVSWPAYLDLLVSYVCSFVEEAPPDLVSRAWLQVASEQPWPEPLEPDTLDDDEPAAAEVGAYVVSLVLDRAADWSNPRIGRFLRGEG